MTLLKSEAYVSRGLLRRGQPGFLGEISVDDAVGTIHRYYRIATAPNVGELLDEIDADPTWTFSG
jgi:hypothetical protein